MRFVHQIRCVFAVLAALGAIGIAVPGAVMAKSQDSLVPMSITLETPDITPGAFKLSGRDALRIAEGLPAVKKLRAEDGSAVKRYLGIPTYYTKRPIRYEVNYRVGSDVLLDLHIDGRNGEVFEQWTGPQADFPLDTRLFAAPGQGAEPLVRLAPAGADLPRAVRGSEAARSACSTLTCWCCCRSGSPSTSSSGGTWPCRVPLVYPIMGYLALRTAVAGFRPRARREKLMPYARTSWLVVGLVALMIFRVGLNVVDSNVMDVGFASVVGADRMTSKEEIYVDNDIHGDTYGPDQLSGLRSLRAALPERRELGQGAGGARRRAGLRPPRGDRADDARTRLRSGREGRRLGVAMAFAWAAYPFTLLGLQANVNDGLVAVLLIFALAGARVPGQAGTDGGAGRRGQVRARGAGAAVRDGDGGGAPRALVAGVRGRIHGNRGAFDRALSPAGRPARVLQLHDRLPDDPHLGAERLGSPSVARLASGRRSSSAECCSRWRWRSCPGAATCGRWPRWAPRW